MLLVHGGAGLDDHARARARQIADLGLVVFACDVYGKAVVGDRDRVMASINELVGDRDKLCRRAQAGVDVLTSHRSVNGAIAAVGYCFRWEDGARAREKRRRAPGGDQRSRQPRNSQPGPPGPGQAKVLVCHGAMDPHVPTEGRTGAADATALIGGLEADSASPIASAPSPAVPLRRA